jgi:hypothetical protein
VAAALGDTVNFLPLTEPNLDSLGYVVSQHIDNEGCV